MSRGRSAAVAGGGAASAAAAYAAGLFGGELASNRQVALQLSIMAALVAWPLFVRGAPWPLRAAMTAVVLVALLAGLKATWCGREGQGSGSDICLGRWALAATCLSPDPLRGPNCPNSSR